jgi:hypothetical protein
VTGRFATRHDRATIDGDRWTGNFLIDPATDLNRPGVICRSTRNGVAIDSRDGDGINRQPTRTIDQDETTEPATIDPIDDFCWRNETWYLSPAPTTLDDCGWCGKWKTLRDEHKKKLYPKNVR